MKIRTQSMISMWLFGIIFVVVTALLFVTNHQVDRINQHIDLADGIERCARELGFLSNDYLLYHEGPQRTRWERKFSSLSADLSKLKIDRQEEQALVENIKANQHRLKAVFVDVISALENRLGTRDQETHMAFLKVSWSRMEVQNQAMIFDALRLARLFRDQVDRVREKMIILFLALVGIFVIHFFFSYLLTNRRILKSISHLGSGTKIIGSGNLDHVLTVKSKDEVGELSDEFNRMTASLKEITASKTELEREIVERKQTEEALQQRTLEFQHLTETLEERVKERTAELSDLTSRLVAAQENERKRVSYDLHDNVWQTLLATRAEIERLFFGGDGMGREALQDKSKRVMASILETIVKIRSMQGDLWPYVLDDIGLLAMLDWYCREFKKTNPGISVERQDGVAESEVPSSAKIVIYRILQETLSNVAKYSRATRVTLRLMKKDHRVEFAVEDNGIGFDPEETIVRKGSWGGLGLLSIKARTEVSGGAFSVETAKGKGTTIRASWPI